MKTLAIASVTYLLLAAACDNTSQVQLRAQQLQNQQLQQEQEQIDQVNSQKCAEQAAKSGIGNPGTDGWHIDVFRNHFSKRLGKCMVLESSSRVDAFDKQYVTEDQIWEPYENTLYMDCYYSAALASIETAKPYENCQDAGRTFPASQVQTHVDSYMSN